MGTLIEFKKVYNLHVSPLNRHVDNYSLRSTSRSLLRPNMGSKLGLKRTVQLRTLHLNHDSQRSNDLPQPACPTRSIELGHIQRRGIALHRVNVGGCRYTVHYRPRRLSSNLSDHGHKTGPRTLYRLNLLHSSDRGCELIPRTVPTWVLESFVQRLCITHLRWHRCGRFPCPFELHGSTFSLNHVL